MIEQTKCAYRIWQEIFPNFPKTFRQHLGLQIDALFIEMLELEFRAMYAKPIDKTEFVKKALLKNDLVKFFLQIAWENKHLTDGKYNTLSKSVSEAGRMLLGWNKQLNDKKLL